MYSSTELTNTIYPKMSKSIHLYFETIPLLLGKNYAHDCRPKHYGLRVILKSTKPPKLLLDTPNLGKMFFRNYCLLFLFHSPTVAKRIKDFHQNQKTSPMPKNNAMTSISLPRR